MKKCTWVINHHRKKIKGEENNIIDYFLVSQMLYEYVLHTNIDENV